MLNTRPSVIRTFGLPINIDFSDILAPISYFVLPPWCNKPFKIVLDLVRQKEDRTYASIYQQPIMQIRESTVIIFLFACWKLCGMCYGLAMIHCNFYEITCIGIRMLKLGQSLNSWKKLKLNLHPKTFVYRLTFVFLSCTIYEAGTSINCDGDGKVCFENICQ